MYKLTLTEEQWRDLQARFTAMETERSYWFSHWREVSDYFLPRRYPWLMSKREQGTTSRRNRKLLDSTSTKALRVLASGMMSGVVSPVRQWFRLRIAGFDEETMTDDSKSYLSEAERRVLLVLAESNFYNSVAVLILEWAGFGTASMGIYEDREDVIRCRNFPLGEFYVAQDDMQRVNAHARKFTLRVKQVVKEFGEENVCVQTKTKFKNGGSSALQDVTVMHLIEPTANDGVSDGMNAPFRELYWEQGAQGERKLLAVRPLYEWPNITPRWELHGDDAYGVSAAMDAIPDVISLQSLLRKKAVGLDKQVDPPLIVDQQLRNRPKALGAGGVTYAATANSNFGAKEAYKVNVPHQELQADADTYRRGIREALHNQLFNMISELDTVRSATEIDARREEKLVHLGPVLERFFNEGLDPILRRVIGIMGRKGLMPEAPPELEGREIEVKYVSVLSDAQMASNTIAIERFLQFIGSAAGIWPEAREIPDLNEMARTYAESIGIKQKDLRDRDTANERASGARQAEELAATAAVGKDLAQGAKVLSDADVGGGMNALQAMMG